MRIKENTFKLLLILLLNTFLLHGQILTPQAEDTVLPKKRINADFCGTDYFHKIKMKDDPQYKSRHLKSVESIKNNRSLLKSAAPGGIFQIPVVVHVMHKGESIGSGTNISNEDVKKGIKYLNNYWRKVNGSLGFSNGVDMKVEFVLAVQDQNGNCTDGIDRVDMSAVAAYVNNGVNRSGSSGINDYDAAGGINSLKEYSIWDPTKYYNVWIVDEIDNTNCSGGSFISGYAYFASAHGQAYDGSVVLICSYLRESDTTWAHEMGHAFNLKHTFDGDDSNGDNIGDRCGDDGVADTPKHIRTSSISPSIYFNCASNGVNACDPTFNRIINPDTGFVRNSGTYQDHMHNYMDYTGCPDEFTGGQRTVVNSALTVSRASYITSPALTPVSVPTAFFTSTSSNACVGTPITFNDESACMPNSYTNTGYTGITFLWTFNNNVNPLFTSALQNPTISFSNTGVYDVTLTVTNALGTNSITKTGNIIITAGVLSACLISSTNRDANFGNGVTRVVFNTINNSTSTFIPLNATNDFTCTKNTSVFSGTSYNLTVDYKSVSSPQHLEVWIDWDNSGTFQISNSAGVNERVLSNNIVANSTGAPSVNITAPASAILNVLLRMRVISEFNSVPKVCANGIAQRADDYGILVKAACTPPIAVITNNSNRTVLTCVAPTISLTASGGASYLWNQNKGITPSISVSQAGTYTVTVTAANGCTSTQSIVISESKPLPSIIITNNSGLNTLTCAASSINVLASGGVSYQWDSGLGNNASATINKPGTYTVRATAANSCTSTKSIIITDATTAKVCDISSSNVGNFANGVTKVVFNTIDNSTGTTIPPTAMLNFICTKNTAIVAGTSTTLNVTYRSRSDGTQFLEVWIDWDNNGEFESSNTNGVNELVLADNIARSITKTATASVSAPATAFLNTILRMRVISEYQGAPTVCGGGFVKRADDYGVLVTNASTTIWNGTAWSSNSPTSAVESVINGIYSTATNGTLATKKLTVTSLGSLSINSTAGATLGDELINRGTVTVQNNANLIQVNNTSNIGDIIVKRSGNNLKRLDYTLWSSPVSNQNLLAFSPLTILNPNRFYSFDTSINLYTNTSSNTLNPATTNFNVGRGYLIRMPDQDPTNLGTSSSYYLGNSTLAYSATFIGTPNNGNIPVTLSTANAKHNLVGNPYPSTINLFTLRANNATVIANTFYLWRKTNGIGTAYCTYVPTTASTGTYTSNGNTAAAVSFTGAIQPGQGFFVTASTVGPLVFNNTQRVTSATSFFKTTQASTSDKIWLNATNISGYFSQMALTYFEEGTVGLDDFDAKHINDSPFALTSSLNNEEYVIQSRPQFNSTDRVNLNFKTDLAGDYTIAIDHFEGIFESAQDIYLVDNKTGSETNLKTGSYNFTAVAGIDNTRFSLIYQKTLTIDETILATNSIHIFKSNTIIHVNAGKSKINKIQVYDMLGKLIVERTNVKSTVATISNSKANKQVIIVKVFTDNNVVTTKKIIN